MGRGFPSRPRKQLAVHLGGQYHRGLPGPPCSDGREGGSQAWEPQAVTPEQEGGCLCLFEAPKQKGSVWGAGAGLQLNVGVGDGSWVQQPSPGSSGIPATKWNVGYRTT